MNLSRVSFHVMAVGSAKIRIDVPCLPPDTHSVFRVGQECSLASAMGTFVWFLLFLCLVGVSDGTEVAGAYAVWLRDELHRVTVLSLCRSSVPVVEGTCFNSVAKGAYILSDFANNNKKKVTSSLMFSLLLLSLSVAVHTISSSNGPIVYLG